MTVSGPLELRIRAEGEIDDTLVNELGSLTILKVPGGAVLAGTVVDTAEFWGILHRLHRAGVTLRSVERLGTDRPPHGLPHHETSGSSGVEGGCGEVRVEVDGHSGAAMSVLFSTADIYQTPPSTTVVLRASGDDALFSILDLMEVLALDLRGIHVDR